MSRIVLTGGAFGLGLRLAERLKMDNHQVFVYDIVNGLDVMRPDAAVLSSVGEIDVLINCAGVNGLDMLQDVTDQDWDRIVGTNAKGIMKMSQACLPALIASKGTILNIVSNAAHVPMTSSVCYNASKGAALMVSKQMARELGRIHGITVFSVSPNKLSGTAMSAHIDNEVVRTRGWTLEQAQAYQKQSLLAGEETDPWIVADFIAFLLSCKSRHKFLAGCDLQYGL